MPASNHSVLFGFVQSQSLSPNPVQTADNVLLNIENALQKALGEFDARLGSEGGAGQLRPLINSFLNQPGKRLRPLLLVESFLTFTKSKKIPPSLFQIAASLEIFHAFILMHDDVIDGSESRRGKATLHKRFRPLFPTRPRNAEHLAIVVGDILFGFSVEQFLVDDPLLCRKDEAFRYFLQTVESTGLGEAMELSLTETPLERVKVEHIRSVYQLKTTRYTVEGPLVLGALLAGAGDDVVDALKAVARPIGFAFQVENDLHEFNLPEKRFAALAHDFRTGMKTYPLFRLHHLLAPPQQKWLEDFLRNAPGGPGEIRSFQSLVQQSGLAQILESEIASDFTAGRAVIQSPVFKPSQRKALSRIIDKILNLKHHSEKDDNATSG